MIPIGSWRLWDANIGWAYLEAQPGRWSFDKLDAYIARASASGIAVLLPLGVTPRWASARPDEAGSYGPGSAAEPANPEQWRNYVRTVARRYAGKVAAYQVLNEANFPSFWSGGIPKLVEITRIAKEEITAADPAAILVAPSGVGLDRRISWVRDFLDAGGAGVVDVASYHLYHYYVQPEVIVPRIQEMKKQLAEGGYERLPLWNTETGYYFATNESPGQKWGDEEAKRQIPLETGGQYLPRATMLARALGFERFFWYAWDNGKMGFIEPDSKRLRPTGKALEKFIVLLLRSDLKRCDRVATGLWTCQLVMANGRNAKAMWTDSRANPKTQQVRMNGPVTVHQFNSEGPTEAGADATVTIDESMKLIVDR